MNEKASVPVRGKTSVWAIFARMSSSFAERIQHKSSAMSSIVSLAVFSSPSCFLASYLFQDKQKEVASALAIIGMIPIAVGVLAFIYFAIFDPDRLHTEDYRLRQQIIELAESKGGKIYTSPLDLASITNPYPNQKKIENRPDAPQQEIKQVDG
jgi:hypothetical protein